MRAGTGPLLAALGSERLGLVAATLIGVLVGIGQVTGRVAIGGDAAFYWDAHFAVGAYVYPPPLAQFVAALHPAGAMAFVLGWTVLCFASLGYVFGRWAPLVIALVLPDLALGISGPWSAPVTTALLGNVTMPMVAAMVAGLRGHPGWWAVPLLTKMTPGIGLAWFAFRREWHALGLGLGVTALIAGLSFVLWPGGWFTFADLAVSNLGTPANGPAIVGPPLWVRLPVALVLIAWGARTNRPWVVPVAGALSLMGLYGIGTFVAVASGAVGLYGDREGDSVRAAAVRAALAGRRRAEQQLHHVLADLHRAGPTCGCCGTTIGECGIQQGRTGRSTSTRRWHRSTPPESRRDPQRPGQPATVVTSRGRTARAPSS